MRPTIIASFDFMKFLVCLFILFLPLITFAQKFEGALFAGICGSQVAGDNYGGFNKAGVITGGSVRRKMGEKTALQMEMYYVQKGSRHVGSDSLSAEFYQIKVNYIEIPLIFQYLKSEKFLFETGISYGVLVNPGTEENLLGIIPGHKPFNKDEIAFLLGTTYNLSEKLGLNFRFSNSLAPIREHAAGAKILFNTGQYSTAIYLTLRYYIGGSSE